MYRPGHSTTDTLFVDDDSGDAFVGDHLLAKITSGAEIMPTELPGDERRRALLEYLSNLRKTAAMQLARCYPGHGPTIDDHRALIDERLAFHSERLDRIAEIVDDGATTAFAIARRLWSDEVAETQTVLASGRSLGHLDILVNRGDDQGARRRTRPPPFPPEGGDRTCSADEAPPARSPADLFDLTGRVALVTGGTRGLGRSILHTLALAGADIVVVEPQAGCVRRGGRGGAQRSAGAPSPTAATSATGTRSSALVDAAYAEFGRVDILVNNAGLAPTYPNPQGVTEELWDKMLGVNLKGPYRLMALVGERMVAGDGGSIVNISSIGGVRPTNDILPYAAAKAGLNALTIGFADALGPKVRVNAVMPGPFLTDISQELGSRGVRRAGAHVPAAPRRRPRRARVSAVLYFASDASSFTTGAVLAVDGGAQWSLAGGGEQAEYGHSLYDGKRDWT